MTSEIDEIYSKISDFLSRGPALTVDIAEYIGKDTTQTAAILDYYVSKGDLGRTEKRYGTSAIYYLKKDIDAALTRLYQTLNNNEKTLVSKIKSAEVIKSEGLEPAERYVSKALGDFIKTVSAKDSETGDTIEYLYYYQLSLKDVSDILNTPKIGAAKAQEKTAKSASEQKPIRVKRTKLMEPLTPEVKNMLFGYGFSNISKIEPDIYYCEYGPNRLKIIAILATKNSISKKDLIKFSGYAASYKTVSFIITNAKKIADYSEYGNLINVIKTN